jgi:hypothetical protein
MKYAHPQRRQTKETKSGKRREERFISCQGTVSEDDRRSGESEETGASPWSELADDPVDGECRRGERQRSSGWGQGTVSLAG